jgi:hypothetical protein
MLCLRQQSLFIAVEGDHIEYVNKLHVEMQNSLMVSTNVYHVTLKVEELNISI